MKLIFPNFETDRFTLSQFISEDLASLYIALSNPEVFRYYGVRFESLEAAQKQMSWYQQIQKEKSGLWWAIRKEGELIGGIGFNNMKIHEEAEIGFWLMPEYWRKGIIQEIAPLLIRYMFLAFDLKKIIAWVESENNGSINSVTSLGFSKDPASLEKELKWGKTIQSYRFDLYRKAYLDQLTFKGLSTKRTEIKPTLVQDAAFIFDLLNSPKWKRFIGDRELNNIEDARDYIRYKMLPQLAQDGFSNNTIRLKSGEKIGVCGLYKRPGLNHADIGFALLPQWERKGYGLESSKALLDRAFKELGFKKLAGITNLENQASQKLLTRLGLKSIGSTILPGEEEELLLFEMSKDDFLNLPKS